MMNLFKQKIKDTLLQLYVWHIERKGTKKNHPHHNFEPNQVGLLYTYEPERLDKTSAILRFAEKLTSLGKKVHIICYQPNNNLPPPKGILTFSKEHMNLWGNFTHPALLAFSKTHFEVFYYLGLETEPMIDYFVAACQARYKVATLPTDKMHLFQVNFKNFVDQNQPINFEELFTKILHYTQKLQLL